MSCLLSQTSVLSHSYTTKRTTEAFTANQNQRTNIVRAAELFLDGQQVLGQSRNILHFVEPESSSPHSQAPTTSPQPAQSSRHPTPVRSVLILSSHLRIDL